jgi:hypothetical protein
MESPSGQLIKPGFQLKILWYELCRQSDIFHPFLECIAPAYFFHSILPVTQSGAAATKEEQEHLSTLFRSEADSLGRMTTGVLRLLDLDAPFVQAAVEQLGSLGMFS